MFTPADAKSRYADLSVNALKVKQALGEIETQFCAKGPTVLSGEYSATLETWLNEYEREDLIATLKAWGWHSIRIIEFYVDRGNKLTVYAKGT